MHAQETYVWIRELNVLILEPRTSLERIWSRDPFPIRLTSQQCDQIRRFLKVLGDRLSWKVAKKFGDFWGNLKNNTVK